MNKRKKTKFRVKDIDPYEHLEFDVKHTTPYQRWRWLGDAWQFWRTMRKTYPKEIIELQDKIRRGEI